MFHLTVPKWPYHQVLNSLKEKGMSVKECAKKMGLTVWAIYTAINEGYGIGLEFKKVNGRWDVDGRKVRSKK